MKGNEYRICGDVAQCLLSNGAITQVSTVSIPRLKQYTWCLSGNGYVMTASKTPAISMQRFLLNAGPMDIVDHVDRDPLNNTLGNLWICTKWENAINSKVRSDNTTGFKGVCPIKSTGRYRAYISIGGKQKHLGVFDTAEKAAEAYAEAVVKLYGDFAPDFCAEMREGGGPSCPNLI